MDTNQIRQFCLNHLKNYFIDVYPIDKILNGTNCKRAARCLCSVGNFLILNSDPSYEPGTHWILLMKMTGPHIFMLDSFGIETTNLLFTFATHPMFSLIIPEGHSKNGKIDLGSVLYNDRHRSTSKTVQQSNLVKLLHAMCEKLNTSILTIHLLADQIQKDDTLICGQLCVLSAHALIKSRSTGVSPTLNYGPERIQSVLSKLFTDVNLDKNLKFVQDSQSRFGDVLSITPSSYKYFASKIIV